MDTSAPPPYSTARRMPPAPVLAMLTWGACALLLGQLDGLLQTGHLALLLVLFATLAALWQPAPVSVLASVLAVLAFDAFLVPPRGTLSVDLHQDAVLLGTMLLVTLTVSLLVRAMRRQTERARELARHADEMRDWSETLRDSAEPLTQAGRLQVLLQHGAGTRAELLVLRDGPVGDNDETQALWLGEPDADRRTGLWHCLHEGQPLGPGAARHVGERHWYLPLRGRGVTLGAAVLDEVRVPERERAALRSHLQALCDQLGLSLQRAWAARAEQRARDEAHAQTLRGTLLAAIAHDHRTPLATILGAASSLLEQDERLDAAQRRRLARTIVDETGRLARLTDNTLQLARLDAPGMRLRCDWESAEELIGASLNRLRRHAPVRRVRARLEPALPLLWCDALLVTQLIDNLLDNALKYSPDEAPVEVLVRRQSDQAGRDGLVLAVRDRGPGIAPAWRARVFEVFQRGGDAQAAARTGVGIGLAVCRAIARAHGGELRLRPRHHGGSSFEAWLPVREQPVAPALPGDLPGEVRS